MVLGENGLYRLDEENWKDIAHICLEIMLLDAKLNFFIRAYFHRR